MWQYQFLQKHTVTFDAMWCEQAKELGVRSVIIDGPDSWCQTLQDEKLIEKFVGIDFSDADSVFDKCLVAIRKVKKVGTRCCCHLTS